MDALLTINVTLILQTLMDCRFCPWCCHMVKTQKNSALLTRLILAKAKLFNSLMIGTGSIFLLAKAAIASNHQSQCWADVWTNYRLKDSGGPTSTLLGQMPHSDRTLRQNCGAIPVPEADLPITLPENAGFYSQRQPLGQSPSHGSTQNVPKVWGSRRAGTGYF